MDETRLGMMNAFSIFSLIVIGAISLAVLIGRRSVLFRRLPQRSSLSLGERVGTIFGSPAFITSVAVFMLLTVLDVIGSME